MRSTRGLRDAIWNKDSAISDSGLSAQSRRSKPRAPAVTKDCALGSYRCAELTSISVLPKADVEGFGGGVVCVRSGVWRRPKVACVDDIACAMSFSFVIQGALYSDRAVYGKALLMKQVG